MIAQPAERLASGLRWTLWLSVLAAPCGYGTSILLARVGPQVIGEYGLLSLYVAITSTFLFFGGPAVAIRFIPALGATERRPFFRSYLLVACVAALPFQLAACLWPGGLHYFFGEVGTPQFHIFLMWMADLYIVFNLAIAGLKSVLELKTAQLLQRGVTAGSFAAYGLLYTFLPGVIATHHHVVIWSVYFGATGVAAGVGLWRFLALAPQASTARLSKLPKGFWRYTAGLQASSALGFLSTKLDLIFILNAGGLAVLGRYVALMTLVSIVPMFATFILDSYLPSLTTLLATGDRGAAERLTRTYVRLIVLFGAGAISFISIFAVPLVRLLGPRYADLTGALLLALPFAGVQIGNWVIGTVYSGIGHPHRDAISKGLRTVIFIAIFWPLWRSAGLSGAVWAWGTAEVTYQVIGLLLFHRIACFRLSLFSSYIPMLALAVALRYIHDLLAYSALAAGLGLWCTAMLAFLLSARYGIGELAAFWRALMPGGRTGEPGDYALLASHPF